MRSRPRASVPPPSTSTISFAEQCSSTSAENVTCSPAITRSASNVVSTRRRNGRSIRWTNSTGCSTRRRSPSGRSSRRLTAWHRRSRGRPSSHSTVASAWRRPHSYGQIASAELPGQRGFAFGPGTAPRLFSFVLAALGAVVAIGGVFAEGPPIEKYKIRGPSLVIIGILGFAAMIRPLGLVPATFLAFMISILGSSEMRWIESIVAAALMTLFCVLLFVYLLNLPFQLWPRFY